MTRRGIKKSIGTQQNCDSWLEVCLLAVQARGKKGPKQYKLHFSIHYRKKKKVKMSVHSFRNMGRLRTSGMLMSSSCILDGLKGNLIGNANLVSMRSVLSDTGSVSWLRS